MRTGTSFGEINVSGTFIHCHAPNPAGETHSQYGAHQRRHLDSSIWEYRLNQRYFSQYSGQLSNRYHCWLTHPTQ